MHQTAWRLVFKCLTEIPLLIPLGVPDGATDGAINDNDKMMITLPIAQGGHTVFSVTETGTAVLHWRVTYSPA